MDDVFAGGYGEAHSPHDGSEEEDMTDSVEAARRYHEAYNAQDAEARVANLTHDAEAMLPGGLTLRGPEQVVAIARSFWDALPDGKISSEHEVAAGDTVVTEGRLSGTHTGTFRSPQGDIPASGNRVALRYVSVKRIRGGKVALERLYFDQLEFLQQIGALPPAQRR
jgi:predicted ester cyclase